MTSFVTNDGLSANSAISRAAQYHECALCYAPLSISPIAYLLDADSQLVCYHTFHEGCLLAMMSSTEESRHTKEGNGHPMFNCLHCRKDFCSISPGLSVQLDPKIWFDYLDANKDGSLSYSELIGGLKAQVSLDFDKIEADLDTLFRLWDKDGNGVISYEEFIDEQNGVLAYLKHHFASGPLPEPPNLLEDDMEEWFKFWDEDNSMSLDKSELTRALIKTFRIFNIRRVVIEQIVEKVWEVFDTDQSGVIELDEFTAPDNLGEALIAQILLETRGVEGLAAETIFEEVEDEEDEDLPIAREIEV